MNGPFVVSGFPFLSYFVKNLPTTIMCQVYMCVLTKSESK